MKLFLRALALFSLRTNHAVGAFLGRAVYMLSPRYRNRLLENLGSSGLCPNRESLHALARRNAAEIGKGATELVWALFRPLDEVVGLVKSRTGWEAVEKLRAEGKSIIYATPHLGSYDVAGRYVWGLIGTQMMAMYRPHKLPWVDRLLREGRDRGSGPDNTHTATTNLAGVRKVLKHMLAGGSTILLPDQVPGVGDGEWVEFFGRPAYTMTLVGRLQQSADAAVVFYFAERLPGGDGFIVHFHTLEETLPIDRHQATLRVNQEVEKLVRTCPSQYLWGYNRYKRPSGAPPPPPQVMRSIS
ncbi:MAG TPA: lysophospholipid acyltransferase family protein [Usitatibacter sp.]